jgi:hypothetical protein
LYVDRSESVHYRTPRMQSERVQRKVLLFVVDVAWVVVCKCALI